jgi:hypothetical protein
MTSTLTCPDCRSQAVEEMLTTACFYFWEAGTSTITTAMHTTMGPPRPRRSP